MISIFSEKYDSDTEDSELIISAKQGNRQALEELIHRHQAWIFNIALRMVGSPHDAEDVTQEILIKMLTKLSTFQHRSSFRTWLYRIASNHILNLKKQPRERFFGSFHKHGQIVDRIPEIEFPDMNSISAEEKLLVEETKISCMTGMLLCLDRMQRMVFILGAVLGANSETGSQILEISPENFRQILSRGRKQMSQFMDEKCGLMNPENPCNCVRKTRAAIRAGWVDPKNMQFTKRRVRQIKSIVEFHEEQIDDVLDLRAQNLFQEHPFVDPPDHVELLNNLLQRDEFRRFLSFN